MSVIKQEDIALAAGIARSTVAMVLNGTASKYGISEKTIKKVEKISLDLGYSKNIFASSLRSRKSNLVGVIGAITATSIAQLRLGMIAKRLKDEGFFVILEDLFWVDNPAKLIADISAFMPEGLIISDTGRGKSMEIGLSFIRSKGIPVIFVDTYESRKYDNIRVDRKLVGYMASAHLFNQGYEKVFYTIPRDLVSRKTGSRNWKIVERYEGFRSAFEEYRKNEDPEDFLIELDDSQKLEENNYQRGYFFGKSFLKTVKSFPAGIVATNDQVAIGLMKSLAEEKIRIPEEVGVVGTENLAESEFSRVPLSTVKFPVEEIARKACDVLLSRIEGDEGERVFLEITPELITRESSLRLPGKNIAEEALIEKTNTADVK